MGHTLRVSTAVVGHRRIWARRLGSCRLADGRLAATRHDRLGPPRFAQPCRAHPGRLRARVHEPRDPERDHPRPGTRRRTRPGRLDLRVRVSELDPLDHVNNAAYVDWLDEALHAAGWGAATRLPRTVRIEYLASAERGDDVTVELRGDAASWAAVIRRSDGLELVRALVAQAA